MNDQQYQDLLSLANSAGWQLVSEYIRTQIDLNLIDLECMNFNSLAEAAVIQGKLRALRTILEFPKTRITGYQNKLKREEA